MSIEEALMTKTPKQIRQGDATTTEANTGVTLASLLAQDALHSGNGPP